MQKYLLLFVSSIFCLLSLAACGGGGGESGNTGNQNPPAAKTTATFKINLTGTLLAGSAISGTTFSITLPANVTPALSNGVVNTGVVSNSGTFAGSTLSPQVTYTAATPSALGTFKVILTNSVPAGVTQVGEVATVTLQLANSAAPAAGDFPLTAVSVIDAATYSTISGMGVNVASVTLQ